MDVTETYMIELNKRLRKGWTAHLNADGRIYYMSHETKISSWLPPVESWDSGGTKLPYGWESAIDKDGKTYYINHTNRTATYECPESRDGEGEEEAPQPREVQLIRDPDVGFGFVAGSEKPVIVRFVTEGGPNEHKLMPGDQILKINGEDVLRSPREKVIELIRSCKQSVNLLVCQPQTNNTTRKSALLTAAKKAKLKNNPSRVRFSEGVIINGSPLYSPSPVDGNVPFLPNVLKVFLENGQTKSFKYDSTTTVQDVLNSLIEKLSIRCAHHFSLATEHVKITRRNRLCILDPKDTLAKIAAKPGAHHLRCVFRVSFVPRDAYDLLQKDPVAFEYLYMQCCNDVVEERFTPELKYDIALRLTALNIQQHCLSNGMGEKVTVKTVERECGLERFVPGFLLQNMKPKGLRKLLGQFLKQSQSLCAPGQKHMTPLQAKLHYLKIISELPNYGSKCFATNLSDSNPEVTLLVSPRFGVSQISSFQKMLPVTLARMEEILSVRVTKEDEYSCLVEIIMRDSCRQKLTFSMEEKDADEFVLLLGGYFRLLIGKEFQVHLEKETVGQTETVPSFHNRHIVKEAPWSYPPPETKPGLRTLDLTVYPPPYSPCEIPRSSPKHRTSSTSSTTTPVDHNMNETLSSKKGSLLLQSESEHRKQHHRTIVDERHPGIDYQTVISMELLEDSSGDVDVDVFEAKNDEVIRRISELNRIVTDAESYLSEPPSNLKAADSLALLVDKNHEEHLDDEGSPSESENDSTPTESPLHRSVPIRNSISMPHHPMIRRDSSFGLHSPDLLPNINSGNDILDILNHLKIEEGNLPFPEGTLCLDPDIIDLTSIPPPITPEIEMTSLEESSIDSPPEAFHGALFDKIENCNGYSEGVDVNAESNHLLDASDVETADIILTDSNRGIDDIDTLIANLTILPPPKESLSTDDLSAYIIPPPPTSSPSTEAQNEVIARFMAAAEDINNLFHKEDNDVNLAQLQRLGTKFKLLEQGWESDNLSSGGDSSGYDTLTSSLTSYNDTIVSDNGGWNIMSSSNDSTPIFDRSPLERNCKSLPVPPCLKTSCVEDITSPLSITSPSSTISSDDSVVLLDNGSVVLDSKTQSCDNLLSAEKGPSTLTSSCMARSASWTNIFGRSIGDCDDGEEELEPAFSMSSSLRQNPLRRSFHRGPLRGSILSSSLKLSGGYKQPTGCTNDMNFLTNGNRTKSRNGQVNGFVESGPFHQALRDVSAMVAHLQKVDPSKVTAVIDKDKLKEAKDALVNESRQFVTSSKLFVKSAMESSEKIIENLAICVALLNRMTAVGELVVFRSSPSEPTVYLVERLKEVAMAFFYTVESSQKVFETEQGEMSCLMQRATTLATVLTSLMRTLRAMC